MVFLSPFAQLGSIYVSLGEGCAPISLTNPVTVGAMQSGTTTLDFSYTKTTPRHYEGWNWKWVPEKTISVIVHVPITVVLWPRS